MSLFGFGYGGARYDSELTDKIARFKDKRRSNEDKINDFLRYDLGVDPDTLPYDLEDAKKHIAKYVERGKGKCTLVGNSLGLQSVQFSKDDWINKDTPDWDVLVKCWEAYRAFVDENCYSFLTSRHQDDYGWSEEEINVKPLPAPPIKQTDPRKYKTGTMLRIANGDRTLYARVGSFESETDIFDIEAFETIPDPEKYTVLEVIDD